MVGERSTILELFKQGKKPWAILKILNMPKHIGNLEYEY